MVNTGELDRKIAIEHNLPAQAIDGEPIENWQRVGSSYWAKREHIDGTERYVSDQFVAREQLAFIVRWSRALADMGPTWRIVYPVKDSPSDSEIYDVLAVGEIGWREWLRVVVARRAEM